MLWTEEAVVLESSKRSVIPSPRAAKISGVILMELLLALAAGAAGIALLVQSKALPSEADAKKAKEKLDANPVDPEANTTYGKYTAFVLGDYSAAMPFLVHSNDSTLKSLAEHELDSTYTDTDPKKVGMGDEWVTAAKKFKPLYRMFYSRAAQWYVASLPGLDDVWKGKVRERLKKILLLPTPTGSKPGLPTGWESPSANPKALVDGTIAHEGGKSFRLDLVRDKPAVMYWVHSPMMIAPKGPIVLSGWFATDGTESAQDRMLINWYAADGTLFAKTGGGFLPIDSPSWQKIEVKADVPKEASRFRVAFDLFSPNGTVWMDDISVKDAAGKEYFTNGSFEK